MENFINALQLIVGISVVYVWVFRYDNVVKEFKQFGLNDLTRNFVGASKNALATLLIAGIWYSELAQISAVLMGVFMIAAQFFHFKNKSSFVKHLPSMLLLVLCIFIVLGSMK